MRIITNEKGVKLVVKKYLTDHDWFWWMPPANGYGRSGVSDFNAVRDGKLMVIETKFNSNTATPLQVSYLKTIMLFGGIAFLVSETNLEYLKVWLEAYEQDDKHLMEKTAYHLTKGFIDNESGKKA